MTGNTKQLGSDIVGPADTGKPFRPAPQNRGDYSNRFHVVHSGRRAIQSDIGREWRLHARLALLAFKAFQKGGFLAADVGPCAMMDIEVEIPAMLVVLANQLGVIGFINSALQGLAFTNELTAHVNVAGVRAHCEPGDQAALDKCMRVMPHDFAVLAGAWLRLIGIDHQIVRAAIRLLGHE